MDGFPCGREKKPQKLSPASWPLTPAWGDIEMPLEVTPVASGQEVTVATKSRALIELCFPVHLLPSSKDRKLSLPDHEGPCPGLRPKFLKYSCSGS